MEYKYVIKGLDCGHCAQKLEDSINKMPGVHSCTINFASEKIFLDVESEEIIADIKAVCANFEDGVTLEESHQHKHHLHDEECDCGHEHHHHDEECGCGHEHHHHHDEECDCGHEHHHHHDEECGCGHEHHHHHDEECDCGHKHHHHHDEACECGHEHHHHHDEACGCEHEHDEEKDLHNLKFNIHGLDCPNCAAKLEGMIQKLEGVNECTLNFASEKIFLNIESDEVLDKIKAICANFEDGVSLEEAHHHKHHHHHDEACDCGHEHHHHHDEACGCEHDHEHSHQEVVHRDLDNAIQLHIHGLDCANCAMKVENLLNSEDYIKSAVINFSTENLQVVLNKKVNNENLVKKLEASIAKVEDGVSVSFDKMPIEKAKLFHWESDWNLVVGGLLFIIGLLTSPTIGFAMSVIAYLITGYKVLLKAFKNIKRGDIFDENFLMCVATIGAFCIGEFSEAVGVMLFYSIGEMFQSYAVNKTRGSVSELMNIKSDVANVLVNGQVVEMDPEEVDIDDIIIVKVGEKIPLDGVILEGNSSIDTSSLTGESLPMEIHEGDHVLAGTVNLTNLLKIKVTQPYEDSTVARIIELMENAASKKAPIERFITKFAKVYTPIVCYAALAVAIIPKLIFPATNWYDWIYRACTFLVVSCPCALVISIPLGLYAGLGRASAAGILIKGGNYLELLKDVNTIVFDKTGTLTKGVFEVKNIIGGNDVLEIGAYGEYLSNHPIAKSIVNSYGKAIDETRISDFKEIAGHGISVKIDGVDYLLGNAKFLEASNVAYENVDSPDTIVYIAKNNAYLGAICVGDIIKETSQKGIAQLKKNGMKNVVMLTGDRKEVGEAVGKAIGVDTVYANLLPQNKVEQVEVLMQDEKVTLAFVGDGINDAPVLARSHIGIAMGGIGSDAAIEASDIVLMNDDINAINEAIEISKKTNGILRQNVTFTLAIKIGVLILTLFGLSNMWMGVFADVGVTLIAILNAIRALK